MIKLRRAVLFYACCGVVVGCGSEKDTTAPPAPRIAPIVSPTGLERVTIEGTAEPGATIVISGAASVEPAENTADPFTAAFRVVVTLEPDAENMLSFVAKDESGNASEPTTIKIEQEQGHNEPAVLHMDLFVNGSSTAAEDPVTIQAGDTLKVAAQISDKKGHVLDRAAAVSTSIPSAFVAGPDISSIQVAGKYSVAVVAAGSSLASSRKVTVAPGKAASIELEATPSVVTAGAAVHIVAFAKDAFGNRVPSDAVTLSSSPKLDAMYTPACSSTALAQGFVAEDRFIAYDLSQAAAKDHAFVLTASSGDVSATTNVKVQPGAAARFAPRDPKDCSKGELFAYTDASWEQDLALPVSVAAGDSLAYRYAVVDAYGNATTGPVRVVTNAPSAQVVDDGVSGVGQVTHLATAGSYELSAYIAGVAAPALRSFAVGVGPARAMTVYTSSSIASPGDSVYAFATIKDAFGNLVSCPSGSIDASTFEMIASPQTGFTAGEISCNQGVFQRQYGFSGNGTYTLTSTYKPGGPVSNSAFVTVLGLDATPPTVSINNLRINGSLCTPSGTPAACGVARGDTVEFDLTGDDNVALSELEYSAFFQTTGTLRTRTVLQSSNASLPADVHFTFTVPGSALPEDVQLVGLAIDGSGNRATTNELILRVGVFATFGRTAAVVASGGSINGPSDVAFNANGDMFIANDGNQNLLEIAHGSTAPYVFSSYSRASRYIAVDSGGNIYLTDSTRITRVDVTGASVVNYLNLVGGVAEGLGTLEASVAKGSVDASSANDGAVVTIAAQSFELDTASDGCGGGRVCVTVSGGATKNAALAASITAQSSSVVASVDAGSGKVVLAAKTAGEAGNSLSLSASGMTISGATLTQGHEQELVFGQTNDNNIYRLPETLTPTAAISANHGAFNVGSSQRGVAVKDMTTASSLAARDLYLYFIDDQNANTLRGYHAVDNVAPASVFSLTNGAGQSFDTLYDVALVPTSPVAANNPSNGCLIVTDAGQGRIYVVDTRNPASTTPSVSLLASGMSEPRGIAFYAGELYVVDRALDAVIRLSPSSDSSDCF